MRGGGGVDMPMTSQTVGYGPFSICHDADVRIVVEGQGRGECLMKREIKVYTFGSKKIRKDLLENTLTKIVFYVLRL